MTQVPVFHTMYRCLDVCHKEHTDTDTDIETVIGTDTQRHTDTQEDTHTDMNTETITETVAETERDLQRHTHARRYRRVSVSLCQCRKVHREVWEEGTRIDITQTHTPLASALFQSSVFLLLLPVES